MYAKRTVCQLFNVEIRYLLKFFCQKFIFIDIVCTVNEIQDRLKEVIESSGYSLRGFAHEIGMTPGGMSGIISGRSKTLSGMFLKVLEFRFKINPRWLLNGTKPMYLHDLTLENPEEIEFITKFRRLGKEQKKSVSLTLVAIYDQELRKESEILKVAEPGLKKRKKYKK